MILVMLMNILILVSGKKITKLVKRSKLTTQQLKAIENPNIVDIKSVTIKHSKTSRKLSKTEKVSRVDSGKNSNSSLFSKTKKIFWMKKKTKITKRFHAIIG